MVIVILSLLYNHLRVGPFQLIPIVSHYSLYSNIITFSYVVYLFAPSLSATRVQQAQLFNEPQSNCDIMVATDAVGMGLNL